MSDRTATYAPGSWVAASGPSTWLLVDLSLDDARLTGCWSGVSSDAPDEVLDALLGGGLAALPAFALVSTDAGAARVVLRHPARVVVTTGADERILSGTPGRTWTDLDLPADFDTLVVQTGESASSLRLPLAQGIGSAGLLVLGEPAIETTAEGDTPIATAGPEPEGAPAREAEPDPGPDPEPATSEESPDSRGSGYYSKLLGSTVDRDTLLAQLADGQPGEAPADELAADPPIPHAASGLTAIWTPDEAVGPAPGAGGAETAPPVEPSPAPPTDGLIAAVPWIAGDGSVAATPATTPVPPVIGARPLPAPPTRPVPTLPPPTPDAAPSASDSPVPTSTPGAEGEAEVHTVNRAALLSAMNAAAASGPTVLAVRCPAGHLTPAYSPQCRVCGTAVEDQEPVREARPALGRLVLSTGEVVVLDRDVILGRAPESEIEDPAFRPSLVRITESGEVSRMHLRIALDGWQPMIRDLGSANGSTLTLSSSATEQMRANQDYVLEPGAEVSLADVVSFRYEVTT